MGIGEEPNLKQIFTISIDEELVQKIRESVRKSSFRNKSHLVEEAIKKFLEEEEWVLKQK